MSKNTGGPAFPMDANAARAWATFEHAKKPLSDAEYIALIEKLQAGMTLRDYFAAKAMQGFAASDVSWVDGANGMAACAYEWADAMLEEREA